LKKKKMPLREKKKKNGGPNLYRKAPDTLSEIKKKRGPSTIRGEVGKRKKIEKVQEEKNFKCSAEKTSTQRGRAGADAGQPT